MKIGRQYAGPAILTLLVAAFGLWHFFDVGAGAAGSGDFWLKGNYGILCLAVFAALLGAAAVLLFRETRWELRFLTAVLSLGSLYLFVLPPLSAPDEISHFMSAYEISSRILGGTPADEDGYVLIRREDDFLQNIYGASGDTERISLGRTLNEETYRILREKNWSLFADEDGREMISSVYRPVRTTPLAYLPQALGIAAARLLGLSGAALAYLGRFFNLAFFALFGFLSVRFLPFGKPVFLGTALLPMTLHLVSSYSYDAFVLGLSFFFGSYCLYLAFEKPAVEKKDILLLAAVMAALGPCKMIYAVVMGFALLIPIRKFGSVRNWALSALTVFAAFGAAMLLVNRSAVSEYAAGAGNFIVWAGEEGYTLPMMLRDPLLYGKLLYNTAAVQGEEWFFTMLGSKLGNLDPVLSVPFPALLGLLFCLVLLSIRNAGEAVYWKAGQKCWIAFLAAACLLGLMTAMLISWTPLSSQVISGVQGRYLLPVLPFVLLTFHGGRVVRTAGRDGFLIFYMCALNGYALLRLFSIVSMRL